MTSTASSSHRHNYLQKMFDFPFHNFIQYEEVSVEQLVKTHLRLVVSIASKKYAQNPYFEDILQEGIIGLIQAAELYDHKVGTSFGSYATHRITHAMKNANRKMRDSITLFTTKPLLKAFSNICNYTDDGDFNLSAEKKQQMSTDLEIPINVIDQCIDRLSLQYLSIDDYNERGLSFDDEYNVDININSYDPVDIIEDYQNQKVIFEVIPQAINCLDEREQDIIKNRYLVPNVMTRQQLGKKLNISHQRVDQIEKVALKKMKTYIEQQPHLLH